MLALGGALGETRPTLDAFWTTVTALKFRWPEIEADGSSAIWQIALMELPQRKRLPHEVPSWVKEGCFFFITINCKPRGQNHLARADVGDSVLAAAAHNHERLVWHCRLMLLMPDHLHAIIAFPSDPGVKTIVTNWKRYLATHNGVDWQRDFFDHRLRNRHEEVEKISYILMNPVRRGLCERAEDWPWVYRPNDRLPPVTGD